MRHHPFRTATLVISLPAFLLSACVSPPSILPTGVTTTKSPVPVTEAELSEQETENITDTAAPTLAPGSTATPDLVQLATPVEIEPLPGQDWQQIPVTPDHLSDRMFLVYSIGQQMGRDPHRFSIIGDCQSIPVYFLTNFDLEPGKDYFLGTTFADLQTTIDWYKGSFSGGVAATGGQNVAAVFSPFWADPALCDPAEGPLACELRLSNSSIALISLEENWNGDVEGYRQNLETIVQNTIQQGVIPVLTTKASNLEGEHAINRTIVEVARAYEVPLWNFWASLQDLPQQGLIEDGFHLTQGWSPRFDYRTPAEVKSGWAMRNLTALQMLDALREFLTQG
jgi:hypothetical protein